MNGGNGRETQNMLISGGRLCLNDI